MVTTTADANGAGMAGAGWGWMLTSGILAALLGLLALIWPFPATYAATVIVGSLFMAVGVLALVAGFAGRGHGRRGYLIGYGLLSIVGGLLLFFFPLHGALTLTVFIVAWLVVRAALELATGFRARRHRGMMTALGLLNLLLAAMIYWSLPFSALTLPGVILGVSLLMTGASEIVAALAHRRGDPAAA